MDCIYPKRLTRPESLFFSFGDLNAEALAELDQIIDIQFSIIELSRKHGRKQEAQILFYLDDVSDHPKFTLHIALLNKLY